jgi:predicted ATPase/DNA-binding CsgD family transcriptional regulator
MKTKTKALTVSPPAEPNRFIGRERELGDLRRALQSTRALTLCGAGGIGKTRLAMRLVASVSEDFADGFCIVELGDLWESGLIVSRVASAIGVDGEPGRPILDTLTDALRSRRMLLLLDNCEHLIGSCARLSHALLAGCPGLRILSTSQVPLRIPPEAVWQVTPLEVPPALVPADPAELDRYAAARLFADRATAARAGFAVTEHNSAAVAAICRALDGVPLAIELAAARVGALSAEQIASRLDDRFTVLGSGDRTAPPRQRTLRATIDWSHDLLSGREQALLRRLSVFAGWSLEMAEQVCADDRIPPADILDAMAALVDKSLVVVEPEVLGQARYRLLDSVRAYARERLAEAGEAEVIQRRMRDYALRVCEQAEAVGMGVIPAPWSAAVDVFRRYDVEADNVRLVLSRCLAAGDLATGLGICTALRPCWIARGSFAEGGGWFGRFLAAGEEGLPQSVLGRALIGRAQLVLANEPALAETWARRGLDLCQKAGEATWVATALNLLAEAAMHGGKVQDAGDLAAAALAAAREAGNEWNEGYALGTQAAVAAAKGNLREAKHLGDAALAVMRAIDQQWGVARTLLGLGALAMLRGDPSGALACHLAALPILREIDSRPDTARCLAGIGRIALDEGQTDLARPHLAESLRLSALTGSRIGVARGLEAFAALAARERRADLTVVLTAAAAAQRDVAGLPPLSEPRRQRHLAVARSLGEDVTRVLWQRGTAMTPDAAVALAVQGDNPTAGSAGSPAGFCASTSGLTAREREIAAHVARGRSNKAIAEDLVISPATAARHVANILAKLGFTSRAQIAAWAAGNDSGHPPAARG